MERFVRLITGGGVLLVIGLWMSAAGSGSAPWLLGVALAAVGSGGLLAGIGREIEPRGA